METLVYSFKADQRFQMSFKYVVFNFTVDFHDLVENSCDQVGERIMDLL